MFNGTRVLVLSCLAIALSPGCTRSKAGPAAAREPAARMVKTEAVRQEAVRRTVEVVGTLAAEDEVTISSQADGVVRRVLADLGDPRQGRPDAGRDRSREAAIQPRPAEGGARARADEVRRHGAGPAAADRGDAGRAEGGRRTGAGEAGLRPRRRAAQAAAHSASRRSTTRRRRCDRSRRPTTPRCRTPGTCGADIDASDATHEAGRSSAARRDHPRAVRRLRPEADGVARRAREEPDAGDDRRARRPAEAASAEIPERMAPWVKVGQPVDAAASMRFPDKTFAGTVSRISPAVNTQTRDVRLRGAGAQRRRAAEAGHVRARASRDRARRAGADDPLRRHAVPLRRLPGVRRRRRSAGRARTEDRRSASATAWRSSAA